MKMMGRRNLFSSLTDDKKKLSGYCGRQPFSMDAIKLNELIVY